MAATGPSSQRSCIVVPAQAGTHVFKHSWLPACAGMTVHQTFLSRIIAHAGAGNLNTSAVMIRPRPGAGTGRGPVGAARAPSRLSAADDTCGGICAGWPEGLRLAPICAVGPDPRQTGPCACLCPPAVPLGTLKMKCPTCGVDNRADRRFCSACGKALPLSCPRCAFLNEPDDVFCGGCGQRLPGLTRSEGRLVGEAAADLRR